MAEHTHSEETERNGGRGVGSVEPWYAGALWVGCLGWQQALWVACWAMNGPLHTGTHWQSIALHHFIKLLVYLFVLLLSARCEREGFLRVRAFRIPVLFLVQSLRLGPDRIGKKRQRERGNEVRMSRERGILTPYRLKRISSSSFFLNLSSCRGLWSIESSPSGSGLLQPLKPFFRNVLNSSKQDREGKTWRDIDQSIQ